MQLLYLFKLDKTGHVTYAYITLSTRCIYLKKKKENKKKHVSSCRKAAILQYSCLQCNKAAPKNIQVKWSV